MTAFQRYSLAFVGLGGILECLLVVFAGHPWNVAIQYVIGVTFTALYLTWLHGQERA